MFLRVCIKGNCYLCASAVVLLFVALPCIAAAPPQTVQLVWFSFETSRPSNDAQAGVSSPSYVAELPTEGAPCLASGWHSNACNYVSRTGNGSQHSFEANEWSTGDYFQFECPNLNASDISVAWDQVSSSNGPARFELECSTDGINFQTCYKYKVRQNRELPGPKVWWSSEVYNSRTHYTNYLGSVSMLNHASTIWFRLVDKSSRSTSGGTVQPLGTGRVDNFMVFGSQSFPPKAYAIAWAKIPSIAYGRRLDAHQLNAWASIPGKFIYMPPTGTVLDSGTSTLAAIFTPSDANYNPATDTVIISVSKAPLRVSGYNEARTVGMTNPVLGGTIWGIANGDNITAAYDCKATSGSGQGDYSIVPTLIDPDRRLANYIVTTEDGTLTVSTGAVAEVVLAQWDFTKKLPTAVLPGGTWYTNIDAQLGNGTAAGWHQRPSIYSSLNAGTNYVFSSSNWNVGDFWQFSTSYKKARNISVVWDQYSSGAGPLQIRVEASSGGTDPENMGGVVMALDVTNDCQMLVTNSYISTLPTKNNNSLVRHVVNMRGWPGSGDATNLCIRLVDDSPNGAGGGRAGPVGLNGIIDLAIYGAVPLATETPINPLRLHPIAPIRPISYSTPPDRSP